MSAIIDTMVEDAATGILDDMAGQSVVEAAEAGTFQQKLWDALDEAGFAMALDDGIDGLGAAAAVARATGSRPAPVPLVETMLARGVAASAGIEVPPGPATLAPPRLAEITLNAGKLSGGVSGVPFASWCKTLVVNASGKAACVDASALSWTSANSYAGEPHGAVNLNLAAEARDAAIDGDMLGALLRAFQMTGAMRTALAITTEYANDRVQFGRALGKFQAIQHMIAEMAENVAAADTAASMALRGWSGPNARILVATAKIRCGEAAGIVAAGAHQVHGAIGFTKEHVLHRFTLRMLAWRDDFGSESYWAEKLGSMIARRGAEKFWPLLASR
jgi:alkylation response protein AidB-like acyl-CoA dehydrogenase